MTARMGCSRWRRCAQVAFLLSVLLLLIGCTLMRGEPTAGFAYSPSICYTGQSVEFDAAASTGSGDDITSYAWQFGDGTVAEGRVVYHTFTRAREHLVELTITTSDGSTATASRQVLIQSALVVPSAYTTIQAAIDAASDGDTVLVLPGTYTESLRIMEKNITVRSSDPDSSVVVRTTTIRGSEYGRPTISLGNGTTSTLEGFTIRPGPDDLISGPCDACAGMVYIREAAPTIRLNRILDSPNSGVGVYESKAHIKFNTISGNSSYASGGGIFIDSYRVAPVITGNTFENNSADTGGAIFINATAMLVITPAGAAATIVSGNSFVSNVATAGYGGAIFVEYTGNLRLDAPDSNIYTGNGTNPVHYVVPP